MLAPTTDSTTRARLTLADRDAILSHGARASDRTDYADLMQAAYVDFHMFSIGAYVDAAGRQIVTSLIRRGYARTLAMRIAIRLEMEANRHGL